VHLESCSFESLGEEEAGDPVALRRAVDGPFPHESNSLEEVIEPRVEGLERRIGVLDPHFGYFTIQEVKEHKLKVEGHHHSSSDGLIKLDKRFPHNVQ